MALTAPAPTGADVVTRDAVCRPDASTAVPTEERAAVLHLLRRATWGVTPQVVAEVTDVGRAAWVDGQLAPASVPDAECEAYLARLPLASMDLVRARTGGIPQFSWDGMLALGFATTARQLWSRRQLLEVVVDVLADHLHVANPSGDVWWSRMDYDVTVVRRHALGRFEDALVASAQHPAMLAFLDNASSTKKAPNENYGRELLELHTVGLGAGYTEDDVRACTRLFTGLGIDGATGTMRFRPERHDTSAVTVLGWSAPAHAAADGPALQVSLLRYLARHPATGRRVATKLARRFVGDDPPAALLDRLGALYVEKGTAIAPLVRELLLAPDALAAAQPKVKRPREDLLSTVRAMGHRPDVSGTKGAEGIYWMLRGRADAPSDWAPPNGFPDVAAAWQSASGSLAAWDQHLEVASGWWPRAYQLATPQQLLPTPAPATVGALVDALAQRVLAAPLAPAERAAVVAFTGRTETTALRAGDEWLGWRLASLVCCVLDSPSFATR
ncbi:DUF1800 domain-containing protein [Pseudokineococcus sp. 1T1Z-3]|uniref:DUF1800 domain-containing protein n=1 Tax=Pseudokineococcus sp. 1T1Z-3 TaxID=3132745 RepID=UPI0030B1B0E1